MRVVVTSICGALNSGDHAQLSSLFSVLREVFPGVQLQAIHRNPALHAALYPDVAWYEQIGTLHTMNRLGRRLGNLRLEGASLARSFFGNRGSWGLPPGQRATMDVLTNADMVVACPGGYLEDGGPAILTHLLHYWLALRSGAKLFVAPQSIGPFRYKALQMLTKLVLDRAVAVCVRESVSRDIVLDSMGVAPECVHTFPDMAFFETSRDDASAGRVLAGIGIQPGEAVAGTTVWPASSAGLDEQAYLRVIARTARELNARHGLRTVFLRQAGEAEGVRGDRELLERIVPLVGDSGAVSLDFHAPEVLRGIIRRCRIFWGTRMHGNIFALAQGVPTVAVAYHPKTVGIMEMFGLEDFVSGIKNLSAADLSGKIDRCLVAHAAITAGLQERMVEITKERTRLMDLLRTIHAA